MSVTVDRRHTSTVLVVDDYDSVRIAITLILERNGFNVLSADSAIVAKGIWMENKSQIDLLIVDISMSAISGPDLVRDLQQNGMTAPVIFVTGISEVQCREATSNVSHALVLHKPFRPDMLVEAVQALCGEMPVAAHN
jgi:two-component system chemotaxis response regulator CheY